MELPLAVSDASEQLDIASHELVELEKRLPTEGRFISVLTARGQGGYRVLIQKRRARQGGEVSS